MAARLAGFLGGEGELSDLFLEMDAILSRGFDTDADFTLRCIAGKDFLARITFQRAAVGSSLGRQANGVHYLGDGADAPGPRPAEGREGERA